MITDAQHRKIRATMMLHGVMLAHIAKREDVTEGYVTYVITGRRKGYRIRKAIAEECGVPYGELWPDEDDPDLPEAA
jgi:lambda repressor-like predicted transcriptional regulator